MKSAKAYFKSISRPFFEFLETKSVAETHDIADASLFVLMALEESRWYGAGVGLTLFVLVALEEDRIESMVWCWCWVDVVCDCGKSLTVQSNEHALKHTGHTLELDTETRRGHRCILNIYPVHISRVLLLMSYGAF